MIHPSSLEDRSSTLPTQSSTSDLDKVRFQFPREKVRCYFNSYTTYEQPKKTHSRRRRRSSQHQKNQPSKSGWEEDEEPKEVVKDEPTPPKSSPQTKQVWKEKVTSLLGL